MTLLVNYNRAIVCSHKTARNTRSCAPKLNASVVALPWCETLPWSRPVVVGRLHRDDDSLAPKLIRVSTNREDRRTRIAVQKNCQQVSTCTDPQSFSCHVARHYSTSYAYRLLYTDGRLSLDRTPTFKWRLSHNCEWMNESLSRARYRQHTRSFSYSLWAAGLPQTSGSGAGLSLSDSLKDATLFSCRAFALNQATRCTVMCRCDICGPSGYYITDYNIYLRNSTFMFAFTCI